MNNSKRQQAAELHAVKAMAAASATPFVTAFKITMGIFFAQLLGAAIMLACFVMLLTVGYLVIS